MLRRSGSTIVLALVAGCQAPAPPAASTAAPTAGGLTEPAAMSADGPKVLVYHDMEGLAGQNDPRTYRFNRPETYPKGQAMLVADLNAVIAGLFDGLK